ncbi:hypothetical protein [Paenibacillus turpanensis]|uniref:hypothetical protein n=1 Tax=Paenibacillus turpanensis TaxID=2689078 RepID=UPI00140B4073|nr:hypothetical protein [Paenibacillus turpanensis]
MGEVRIENIQYQEWGNAVRITNGMVEAVVSIDFGPRVLRCGFVGGQNFFMENTAKTLSAEGPEFEAFGGGKWYIYGGHRLWTSPEALPRTYYPDNAPVSWCATDNGAMFTPPAEKWTNIQKEIEISLQPEGTVFTVDHRITNVGPWPVEFAVWSLSVMTTGGTAIIPNADRETGLLANRSVVLWPYSKMNDPRVTWGEKVTLIRQGNGPTPFKLGTPNEKGWAAYFLNNQLFLKQHEHKIGGTYPDDGCSFESYVCDHFLELETLGELRMAAPGEVLEHKESWKLVDGIDINLADETEILGKTSELLD